MEVNKFTIALLLVGCSFLLDDAFAQTLEARIVGGTATTISEVPYLVYLRVKGSFICGGTLIAERFVLTAGHCVKGVAASTLVVHGGTSFLNQAGVARTAAKIILPSGFNINTLAMDVAIIKLSSAMTGTNIKTISLCSHALSAGDVVRVSGWGTTSENANSVPNQVRTAQIKMITKQSCVQQYRGEAVLTDTMICGSVPGEKDTCSGDSGGPLVHGGQVCGIVSWGVGCARQNYPGVYTAVNMVKSFISKAMAQ